MKAFYPLTLIILFVVLCFKPNGAYSTHAMGADLTYTWIGPGPNDYSVVLSFYRDCSGTTVPATETVTLSSSCAANTNITMTQSSVTEVSPLCPSELGNSTCSAGPQTQPGVEQYVFRGTVTLPSECQDWLFSYRVGNRNDAITTVTTPGTSWLYLEAMLNNLDAPQNSSPQFTSIPVPYICVGQEYNYNNGSVDADGDSLVYSLVDALDNAGVSVNYSAGFSGVNPLSSTPAVTIDGTNGNIVMNPTAIEFAVVAVLVEEYRNGILIGTTRRDIQVVVQSCTNVSPIYDASIQNLSGAVQTGPYSIEICPGVPFSFEISSSDGNLTDNITMSWNNAIPGASFTTTGTGNPVTGTFSWTPTPSDAGFHGLVITIQDDGCPILSSQTRAIDITVHAQTETGGPYFYCPASGPRDIQLVGGSVFTVNTLSGDATGLNCFANCPDLEASPNQVSVYEVTSNLPATCKNVDTFTVEMGNEFSLLSIPDSTICLNDSIQLTTTPSIPGTYNFTWTPDNNLSDPNISSPVSTCMDSTRYYITASNGECIAYDSVTVRVAGSSVFAMVDDEMVCPGTPVTLDVNAGGGSCVLISEIDAGANDMVEIQNLGSAPVDLTGWTLAVSNNYTLINTVNAVTQSFTGTIAPGEVRYWTDLTTDNYWGNNLFWNPGSGGWAILIDDAGAVKDFVAWSWSGTDIQAMSPTINGFPITIGSEWNGNGLTTAGNFYARQGNGDNNDATDWVAAPSTKGATNTVLTTPFPCGGSLSGSSLFTWSPTTGLSDPNSKSPTLIASQDQTYSVEVADPSNGNCLSTSLVTVRVDSSVYAQTLASNEVPCPGEVVQLTTQVTGVAEPNAVCGINGSTCGGPSAVQTIGTGTAASSSYVPFPGTYADVKYQFLFRASELIANGINPGTMISSVGWNISSKLSTGSFENFTISMGCTQATDLVTAGWESTNLVRNPQNVSTVLGWNDFVLDFPYDWDGTSNLVVEVCFDHGNNSNAGGTDTGPYTTTTFYSVMRNYTNTMNNTGCSMAPSFRYTSRGNMRFTSCALPPPEFTYSWSPIVGLDDPTAPNPEATFSTDITYTLTIDGGVCPVIKTVDLVVCPLILDELVLKAHQVGQQIVLEWTTKNEINSAFFSILKRDKNGDFNEIGTEPAHGLPGELYTYSSVDIHPVVGENQYWIKETDELGNHSYSNVATVWLDSEASNINVYPNPIRGEKELEVQFYSSADQPTELRLYDLSGKEMMTQIYHAQTGPNSFSIPTNALAAGTYLVQLKGTHFNEVTKLVVTQ